MTQCLNYTVANAFTACPLEGNPVAVFHHGGQLSSQTMQALAKQLQLSETTFIVDGHGTDRITVRIFTPVNELPFAGHPLMGTARVYSRLTGKQAFTITTHTGDVPVSLDRADSAAGSVRIGVPLVSGQPFFQTEMLLAALGLDKSVLPVEIYDAGARHVLVAVEDIRRLRAINYDYRLLSRFENLAVNCFAFGGEQVENRMFSPAYGVVEDAGTGSAVAPILLHLWKHNLIRTNTAITIAQGIALKRRCMMQGSLHAAGEYLKHVELSGQVVLFSDCALLWAP